MSAMNGMPTRKMLDEVHAEGSTSKLWLVIGGRPGSTPEVLGCISGYWKGGGDLWELDLKKIAESHVRGWDQLLVVEIPTGTAQAFAVEHRLILTEVTA